MSVTANDIEALRAKVVAKENQITELQDELDGLRSELKEKAREFTKACGIEEQAAPAKKKSAKKSTGDKASERWRVKAILETIHGNKNISKESLTAKLKTQKPGAKLDKLDDYLKEYTNNDAEKLALNAEGKKLMTK